MGLFDRRKPKTVNLADGTEQKRTATAGMTEVGVAGNPIVGSPGEDAARADKYKIEDYIKMRNNDGTVAGLYSILTMPVMATPWSIVPGEGGGAEEQRQLIEDNFKRPPHRGGMEIPMTLVLADMLRATLEGFRLFEKVLMLQDGKVVYRKLARRESTTVTLLTDKTGGYDGARQQTSVNGLAIDVTFPAWKTFLFTYNKDRNYLYGQSAFRPAAYHYENVHKLYYLANLSVQVSAIPPQIFSGTETDQGKIRTILGAFSNLGNRTVAWKPAAISREQIETSAGRVDPIPLIDHHDTKMARSVLAQFIMLGTTSGSKGGSFALSQDHSDLFIMALKGLMQNIEDHINYYVIPDLIDLNFANPVYPEFKFEDITSDTKAIIKEAFNQMVTSGKVSPAVMRGIEERMVESLEIDREAMQKLVDEEDKQAAEKAKALGLPDPNQPPAEGGDQDPKGANLSASRWHRALTPAEERVDFAKLESRLNEFDETFQAKAGETFDKLKNDTVMRLTKALESGDALAVVEAFKLDQATLNEYSAFLVAHMRDAYEYAKKGAADELRVASPATARATTKTMRQEAAAIVERQAAELVFEIKSAVLSEVRRNNLSTDLGISDVLAALVAALQSFMDRKVAVTGSLIVAQAVTEARADVFETARKDIYAYQYSALLDHRVCPRCRDLDGSVVDYATYRSTKWRPPIHFNCRCIWVAIRKDEQNPPPITGFPDAPGGFTTPDF